jgi:hypothetical protein
MKKSRNMTIWIINHYAGNSEVGPEYRHYLIAKELQKYGCKVYIISSSFTHLLDNKIDISNDFELKKYDDVKYCWIKTSDYSGNGFGRFKNMFEFSFKLQKNYKKFNMQQPDFVIASSPHPFVILNGYFISKYYKAKFIFEERDLWPLSIIKLTSLSKINPIVMLMQALEDFAYKHADLIVSPLVNLENNIKERKIKHKDFLHMPNGILIEDMEYLLKSNIDINKYKFPNKFLIGFAGTVGVSNCVDILIKSAHNLQNYDIGFVIIGEGEQYKELTEYVNTNKLSNVYLLGKKKKDLTMQILDKCDVLYNAAPNNELYSYGLSAIKLPEYMYLEKYIINAVSIKNDIIELSKSGSTIMPGNIELLEKEILKLYHMDKNSLRSYGTKAKQYVLNNLTYPALVKKLINKLDTL